MAGFRFSIDRGGTFTDVYAECPGGKIRVLKLLSEDFPNYRDAPTEAVRRVLEKELGHPFPKDELLDSSLIEWIRMGTTVATNALLQRKGERMALIITKGFRDLLHIGNQSRPNLFDLTNMVPDVLYERVVEVEERIVLQQDACRLFCDTSTCDGISGEKVHIVRQLNKELLRKDLEDVLDCGIECLAICCAHSYTYSRHEEAISKLAKEMGFSHVSLSSHVMPMVRMVPRGYTACADSYLTPCIHKYMKGFVSGFKNKEKLHVLFMQSDGGLTQMSKFCGSRAILSGPAGGVVGYATTTYKQQGTKFPVIGFDMGGTSTDISRYDGDYEHVFESTTAGVSIQAPQLDINTVAAGGGSTLSFRSGMFIVGPESAGANPGPACYGRGGPLTVTDANLCLGRLLPKYFPKVFGLNEDASLQRSTVNASFEVLTSEINTFLKEQNGPLFKPMNTQEVAMGFIKVANETMSRPIRALTQGKGHDTFQHVLACFGGAGGQHACAIARSLGMSTVYIHRYSGILSAYGLALADVVYEAQEPCAKVYRGPNLTYFDMRMDALTTECVLELEKQGFGRNEIRTTPFLHLRYEGTDCALMVMPEGISVDECRHGNFKATFTHRYMQEFGFTIPERSIIVDDIRVRGKGKASYLNQTALPLAQCQPTPLEEVQCYFDGGNWSTQVFQLVDLTFGHSVTGPAIIVDKNSTLLVEPGCRAEITQYGDVMIKVSHEAAMHARAELNTIQLSVFSHRFMSIAEQMGRVLQRTSISTNIKERLDFSCALFGPDGGLVANAPHIPVHLGAMQHAVQWQISHLASNLNKGDVLLTNHPAAGGSHLPDLTVITPVFYNGAESPVFFVANRGHHADIGGITPGSMPPNSKYLWEEGMCVKSFKLVEGGAFQEEGVKELLMAPGKLPGCSGSRNLRDNISDLRAQVAANQKGISLVTEFIESYGLEVVQAYMEYIQENAEVAVRDMLKEIASKTKNKTGKAVLAAEDMLDDGTPIVLQVSINEETGSAVFDFVGTGPQVPLNLNAPRQVTFSAILYCLRCMVGHNVPLNKGCLKPIEVLIPPGCILDPSEDAAVIGGNVLTCQRVVDVIFKAFSSCAASQGCMNNTTFGDDSFGYYETVAGGAGAGPTWHGRSGIHTHMTNTRITDPEILERRYPVILQQFSLNPRTGGIGQFNGGDGVVRELQFRKPLTLTVLSERRVYCPYGLEGGEAGRKGENKVLRYNGSVENVGGKAQVHMAAGDIFRLETPGGGGFGVKGCEHPPQAKKEKTLEI